MKPFFGACIQIELPQKERRFGIGHTRFELVVIGTTCEHHDHNDKNEIAPGYGRRRGNKTKLLHDFLALKCVQLRKRKVACVRV
jgi:hypothetical protein